MPVILATQKAEIRRIMVRSQPGQIVCETLAQKKKKNPSQKRAGGVIQGVGPEFKPQVLQKKKKNREKQSMILHTCSPSYSGG
jgi:predicted PP-loop superfamily ATPase